MCWSLLLIVPAAGAALSPLYAQQTDTTKAADSVAVAAFSWVSRLVPLVQDAPKPYRLHLPWDEWGHSDLVATAANPFVTADLQAGAARLDGSLGQPIFSTIIPSAMVEHNGTSHPDQTGSTPGSETTPPSYLPTFIIAPLHDQNRNNQTYFYWDQGDYSYQDVQVGSAVALDESRNIMIAGHGRSHPGQHRLAGPSLSRNEGNVLQNYLLDYQRRIWPSLDFNYTLLHQREQVGLPVIEGGNLTADRRRNYTWVQGFRLEKLFTSITIQLYGSSMVSDLRTTTDGSDQAHLSRRSLSIWGGADIIYRLTPNWHLTAKWDTRQRHIADRVLGYQPVSISHSRLGASRENSRGSLYGGLALINGQLAPEAWLTVGSDRRNIAFGTEATSFFDYPHLGRRITLDSTPWLPGPIFLRRTTLALQARGSRGLVSARLALLSTGDRRTATTAGAALEWTPWKEVLRLRGTVTAVSSPDTILFPPRINAQIGLTFTLPLRRARARPFVSLNTCYIHNDFAWWNDPRFADMAPINPAFVGGVSKVSWLDVELGLKVTNFELLIRLNNITDSTIENSPEYIGVNSLNHYSLTWRFLPQGK